MYGTRSQDNEEQSAALAVAAVDRFGFPQEVGERVSALILATKHDGVAMTADAALLIDVDLSILGAPVARFDEYERQIRQEYSWVPGFMFRRKRREILEAFLARAYVYNTEHFRGRYEATARANLTRSIERLASR